MIVVRILKWVLNHNKGDSSILEINVSNIIKHNLILNKGRG